MCVHVSQYMLVHVPVFDGYDGFGYICRLHVAASSGCVMVRCSRESSDTVSLRTFVLLLVPVCEAYHVRPPST